MQSDHKSEGKTDDERGGKEEELREFRCSSKEGRKPVSFSAVPATVPNVDLAGKWNSLQIKTRNLREKLARGFGAKRALKRQEQLVGECAEARSMNDEQAALCMKSLSAKTTRPLPAAIEPPKAIPNGTPTTTPTMRMTTRNRKSTDTSSNCSMELPKILPTMLFGQQQKEELQQPNEVRKRRATRRQLEIELHHMRDLLAQLTVQNPQIEIQLRTLLASEQFKNIAHCYNATGAALASTSRNVSMTDVGGGRRKNCTFQNQRNSENSNVNTLVPKQQQQQHQQWQQQSRRESLTSNASSIPSPAAADAEQIETTKDDNNQKKKRTRGKNRKAQRSKTQQTEMDALLKYLKMIVQECLGEKDEDKLAEYAYKPDEEDLEAYAQRLMRGGLGRIVEEEIRINRKNNRQSFITMTSNDRETIQQRDGIVLVPVARRYAFEGDIVRAFVMKSGSATHDPESDKSKKEGEDKENAGATVSTVLGGKDSSFCDDDEPFAFDSTESPDSDLDPNDLDATVSGTSEGCPKAFVIKIVKQTEKREVVGTITFKNPVKLHDGFSYYRFKPHDMRVPMIYVPETDACSEARKVEEQRTDVCGLIYVVMVCEVNSHGYCIGKLHQGIGKVGNLKAEIKAILLHNGLKDVRPYEQRFDDMFAKQTETAQEDAGQHLEREDLREKCIFTIDPLTARDLDDALSVELISEQLYEIGVHISDVAHYLPEDSELDNLVKMRATSIYLVNEVIHMLPPALCSRCSLMPGEDKYAFSVFWKIELNGGSIVGEPRFTRSIINSCTQFAYEHAQKIIENPKEQFDIDDFPTICNGFTPKDIMSRVLILNTIAKQMRKERYDNGALSINNPKLCFTLNPYNGEPMAFEVDARQDANYLIEEFMLLANQTVAYFIYDRFPDIAILRNHSPPLSKSLKALKEKLSNLGMNLDISSSKAIYTSMQSICDSAANPTAMNACLSTMLTKPMARAKYFCSDSKTEETDLWHYALSIPIYTHFTSPIRRYPDILVHRLLAAALNYCPPPKRTTDELQSITKICNEQKFNAKSAGDESINLFFKRYIKFKQSITLSAVVMEIYRYMLNVVTIKTGHVIAIDYKAQKVVVDTSNVPAHILISENNSKNPPLKLQMFSVVDIKLVVWDNKIMGYFVSPDLKQRQLNSIQSSKKRQQNVAVQQQQQQQHQQTTNKAVVNANSTSNTNKLNKMMCPISNHFDIPSTGNAERAERTNNKRSSKKFRKVSTDRCNKFYYAVEKRREK